MYGFETVGNATLIVHDGDPLLTTDPWVTGEPYFGSWTLAHEIPSASLDHIRRSRYLWYSHGHPDHLNSPTLDSLSGKEILLPDHVGRRIELGMKKEGFNVRVLPTRQWMELSPRVKVLCLPDYNQDAALLVALGDHLVINLNDGAALGHRHFLKKVSRPFKRRWVLALRNYGDADMINLWDETGKFLPPPASLKPSVGKMYEIMAKEYDATDIIPFSAFHGYQREDSLWAAKYATPLFAHSQGYSFSGATLHPAFVSVDVERDSVTPLNPQEAPAVVKPASAFGDNWSEVLEKDEVALCRDYFLKKAHVAKHFGFITLRVGGKDEHIVLNPALKTGVRFECPRGSLLSGVKYEIFDDLLIGNFVKTTLYGVTGLYPDFTPYVAKYADNGLAQSEAELKNYFRSYRERSSFLEFTLGRLRDHSESIFRRLFSNQSTFFNMSRKAYRALRRV